MTFQSRADILAWLEQMAEDGQRKFETHMLTRDNSDLNDDICDVIDGCRAWHEEAMIEWRIQTRRQLEAVPFRFPLTVTWDDAHARQRRADASGSAAARRAR